MVILNHAAHRVNIITPGSLIVRLIAYDTASKLAKTGYRFFKQHVFILSFRLAEQAHEENYSYGDLREILLGTGITRAYLQC
jgi:hypothetical protein